MEYTTHIMENKSIPNGILHIIIGSIIIYDTYNNLMSCGQSYKLDDRRHKFDIIIFYLTLKYSCPLCIYVF